MSARLAVPLAVLALGAAVPAASAAPVDGGFAASYPHAARLCARANAGALPARVADDAAAITSACTTLETTYGQAAQAYTTALAPIPGEVQTVIASLQTARQAGDPAGLAAARGQARTTLRTLRGDVRGARLTYRTAVQGARVTFWSTVGALPGAGTLPTDTGPTPDPSAPSVPSAS